MIYQKWLIDYGFLVEADVNKASPVKVAPKNKGPPQHKPNAARSMDDVVSISFGVEPKFFKVFVKARKIQINEIETNYHVNIPRESRFGKVSLIPEDTCSPEDYDKVCDLFISLYQQVMMAMKMERFSLKSGKNVVFARKKIQEMSKHFPVLVEFGKDQKWELYGEEQHLEDALQFLEREKVEIKRESDLDKRTKEFQGSEDLKEEFGIDTLQVSGTHTGE